MANGHSNGLKKVAGQTGREAKRQLRGFDRALQHRPRGVGRHEPVRQLGRGLARRYAASVSAPHYVAAAAAGQRPDTATRGSGSVRIYLCPQCGEVGTVIAGSQGFTRLVCRPCRLSFEQPTEQPAHEGYRL